MRPLLAIAALLLLTGCSSESTPAPQTPATYPNVMPSSRHWSMEPESWDEYDITPMIGTFNRDNGSITVVTTDPTKAGGERITNLSWHMPQQPAQLALARVHTQKGEPALSVDPSLRATLLERQTEVFIGEAGNFYALSQDPPEPLLSLNPYPGEVLQVFSKIQRPTGETFLFETLYRTISVGDEVVTTLVEMPGQIGRESAYTHWFDGSLKRLIYGEVDGQGAVTGYLVERTASGRNP